MLVLTRQAEQEIRIGPHVRVRVLSIAPNQVRLGIVAPPEVAVHRGELLEAVEQSNAAAARPPSGEAATLLRSPTPLPSRRKGPAAG